MRVEFQIIFFICTLFLILGKASSQSITFLGENINNKFADDNLETILNFITNSQEDLNLQLQNQIQEFIATFPANFKKYFTNFRNNKDKIYILIQDINPLQIYSINENISKIIKFISDGANYKQEGLDSFIEFQYFSNCYSSLRAADKNNYEAIKMLINISLKEKIEDFIKLLGEGFDINISKSDKLRYCLDLYKHLYDM